MKVFEQVDGSQTLSVEASVGLVCITIDNDSEDLAFHMFLDYPEWDKLVAAVAKAREEQPGEKFNANGTGY